MEHLKQSLETQDVSQSQDPEIISDTDASEHQVIRKELVMIIVSMTIIVLTLVGLMVFDKRSDKFADFSHYISSFFIK